MSDLNIGEIMEPKIKVYGVWNIDDVTDEAQDAGFWEIYHSIEDALSANGDHTNIYELSAKFLGNYKRQVQLVKSKRKLK